MKTFTIKEFQQWARKNKVEMFQPSSINKKSYVELDLIDQLTDIDFEADKPQSFNNPNQKNLF